MRRRYPPPFHRQGSLASYVRFFREGDPVIRRLRGLISGAISRGASPLLIRRYRRHLAARFKYLFRRAVRMYFIPYHRRPVWARRFGVVTR